MTARVQNILRSFEQLSESEKKDLAFEILQRTTQFDLPPVIDDILVSCAEDLFLSLDREELTHE
ncbi:hypothetical protein A3J77_00440 [Candidatus Wolfebacteria bacterium RBG_13_41_7]|uniref:Uncharacterized protein n=1 Tax=Candidatus Wolfebacteria bacterium RBG_13_41_7 TaxID=1802554 RepID=A0A1F8DP22_9BACT|nr:MAG: hypothetical protein A3J77_00440 [Candidatus Wolfebacteria bacterium RBG_13_41_7]